MPTITIDGRKCEFEGRKMILQVALDHGIAIPHYCYHPGMSIVASCRICLAEIAQPNPRNDNKVEIVPKLMPTCQTPAADGMEVYTTSPKSIANQKAVMEYLLINHPLDCPVCDQAGECYLQDYSYQYGRGESRFKEEKIKQPKKDVGPHVLLYADRCIMCTRCVRFTREVTGTNELGIFGRGAREQIDVFPGVALDNELSGNVVDICPVGALLDKDFLFTQRVWFLTPTPSIDGLTASGDNIYVEHNEGRVYRVKPRTNLEINQWWISDEIRYGWKFVHSDARLTTPQRQQLGALEDCSWDSACADAVTGLRQAVKDKGPGCLAAMISPMLSCEDAYLLGRLVRFLDPEAILAVGPAPTQGQDRTLPGGYTVRAEKCPNRRGVRRALELLCEGGDQVMDFEPFMQMLADKECETQALIVTGNYPGGDWPDKDLVKALARKFVVAIDTLPNALLAKANVVLPGATWMEKAGTFENAAGILQSFGQAIVPIEFARPEAQIALDLLALVGERGPARFDAEAVRQQMSGPFITDVRHPTAQAERAADMQYVAL
jgi:NADH-quinone oxidoreductase subunit G